MLLFYDVPMLQPILKAPVYKAFCQIPEIRRLKLTQIQHEKNIINFIDKKYTIEQFTHEKYIGEISK